jgi:pyruvate kinase
MTVPHGKTKIVCTLGPSTSSVEILVRLIRAGMDVVRLNFSHGTYDDHVRVFANVRTAMEQTGGAIGVLQDLQGPKIRIGDLAVPFIELVPGGRLTITTDPVRGEGERVSTTYARMPEDVRTGDSILLDDGKMQLRVVRVIGADVECEVVVGGKLSSHKGINLPGVKISAPSCTPKDLEDLAFGLGNDVDYVALSFVRSVEDITQLRTAIAARGVVHGVQVIAKIEKPEAVEAVDGIIAASDGIMIARGDLGVELPPEDVPILQKRIIRKCNDAGKPVIVATQMLESMIGSPTPTRAEASDVANAVLDGGDAVMLSGETSVGKYPLEAVEIMSRIIARAESAHSTGRRALERVSRAVENRHDALGRAACVLAEQMNAAAIVAVTRSGQTARVLARYRPDPPIIAITDSVKALRVLSLVWGVHGAVIGDLNEDSDRALQKIQEHLLQAGFVRRGEYVVLLAGQPFFARGSTNFIKVEQVV